MAQTLLVYDDVTHQLRPFKAGDVPSSTAGTITVNTALALAAGADVSCLAGGTDIDLSLSTGFIKTPTGANTLSGDVTVAAGKDIAFAAGDGAFDASLGTGITKTTTGTNTLNGDVVIAGSKTLTTGTGLTTFNGKVAAGATAWNIADPGNAGAIPVTSSGVCNLTSAGAETRTLAAPTFEGQRLTICMNVDGGDIVLTVASAINQAGNTQATFNDAGDTLNLIAARIAGALRWRLINNDGATLA